MAFQLYFISGPLFALPALSKLFLTNFSLDFNFYHSCPMKNNNISHTKFLEIIHIFLNMKILREQLY